MEHQNLNENFDNAELDEALKYVETLRANKGSYEMTFRQVTATNELFEDRDEDDDDDGVPVSGVAKRTTSARAAVQRRAKDEKPLKPDKITKPKKERPKKEKVRNEKVKKEKPEKKLPASQKADKKKVQKPFFARLASSIFPMAGDPWWEILRKILLLIGVLVFIGAGAMLLNESVIIPEKNIAIANEMHELMIESRNGELTAEEAAYDGYPEGITTDFKKLYYLNNDVRGWLTFPGGNVDKWVMYSKKDDYYLYRDIYGNNNKNGSLFLDPRCEITAKSRPKSLVIYGHNMASGQMFAGLNRLASSIDNMKRAAGIVKFDTLYDSLQYKIFAVVIHDPNAKLDKYYSIQTASFTSDQEFLNYTQGLRDRSLYDFNDVDIVASDEILIMYTCCPKSIAGFDDARVAVVARKVRPGESATVSASKITQNKDVIMPYAWYTAKKKTPHAAYTPTTTTPATTTTAVQPGVTTAATSPAVTEPSASETANVNVTTAPNTTAPQQGGQTTAPVTPPTVPTTPATTQPTTAPQPTTAQPTDPPTVPPTEPTTPPTEATVATEPEPTQPPQ